MLDQAEAYLTADGRQIGPVVMEMKNMLLPIIWVKFVFSMPLMEIIFLKLIQIVGVFLPLVIYQLLELMM